MSYETEIIKLRAEIDAVDDEVLKLLNKRAEVVLEVGRQKQTSGKDVYVPEREKAIYDRLISESDGPLSEKAIRNVFREIISASRSLEKTLTIAFLGPPATFTHQAALQYFGLSAECVPKIDISDVFSDVEKGKAQYGVVPIENSTEGVVSHTLDMFITSDLQIYDEKLLQISLALINKSGKLSDVTSVCSHPHATAQCRQWLKEKLPGVQLVDVSSTAMAAQRVSLDSSTAAIASEAAADLYDLQIVERGVEDSAKNFTRFLVLSKNLAGRTGEDKTSVMFSVKDSPGSLFKILTPFASREINLTKIESRPAKEKAWEYIFFLDIDGHIDDREVAAAIEELREQCLFVKILGSYPRSQEVF